MKILTHGWLNRLSKIDFEYEREEREQVPDIRWINKLESKALTRICINTNNLAIKSSRRITKQSYYLKMKSQFFN